MLMSRDRHRYKANIARLKEMKGEFEHLQHLVEQAKRRIQQDYDTRAVDVQPSARQTPVPVPVPTTGVL